MQDYSNTKQIHAPFRFFIPKEFEENISIRIRTEELKCRTALLCVTWSPVMTVKKTMRRLTVLLHNRHLKNK